jgi:hypothetical protein
LHCCGKYRKFIVINITTSGMPVKPVNLSNLLYITKWMVILFDRLSQYVLICSKDWIRFYIVFHNSPEVSLIFQINKCIDLSKVENIHVLLSLCLDVMLVSKAHRQTFVCRSVEAISKFELVVPWINWFIWVEWTWFEMFICLCPVSNTTSGNVSMQRCLFCWTLTLPLEVDGWSDS